MFETESTATQTITSPFVGGSAVISAHGLQTFTIDTTLGTAGVTSAFYGSDFPDIADPSLPFTYFLTNTTTIGTVTTEPSGSYDISFRILFTLTLTSGPDAGVTFQTKDYATFDA